MKSLTVTVNNKTQALKFLRWAQKQWPSRVIDTWRFRELYHPCLYSCRVTAPANEEDGWDFGNHDGNKVLSFADFEAKYLK